MTSPMSGDPIVILYTNWRGETATRKIIPFLGAAWFGSTEWHPEPEWLFAAHDVEKDARRDFALSGIKAWGQEAVDAALRSAAQPQPDAGVGRAEAAEQAVRWCRPRLSKDVYRTQLDRMLPLGPAPESAEPRLVQSAALTTERPSARDEEPPSEANIRREAVNYCDKLSDSEGDTKFLIRQSKLVEMFAALLHARRSSVKDEALEAAAKVVDAEVRKWLPGGLVDMKGHLRQHRHRHPPPQGLRICGRTGGRVMSESNPKNRTTEYKWVQYETGPFSGKFVVREIVEQDVAAVLTQGEAIALINRLKKADKDRP